MLRGFILGLCVCLSSFGFAATHTHPEIQQAAKPAGKNLGYPGFCEIEIINNSFDDVRVSGIFDDGTYLQTFYVYGFESPHYISLYYYGYCHSGMNISIDTYSGYRIYNAYTPVNSTIRIVPFLTNQLKVDVKPKSA